jgi:hypothetical protein
MAREVTQVVETENDDGRSGTITVITTDDYGTQRASTREYNDWSSSTKQWATEDATQDSLSKS